MYFLQQLLKLSAAISPQSIATISFFVRPASVRCSYTIYICLYCLYCQRNHVFPKNIKLRSNKYAISSQFLADVALAGMSDARSSGLA